MSRRAVFAAIASSLVVAFFVGAGFAFYDWRLNPGGIFRGPDGTNWRFMYETTISWLAPTFLSLLPVSFGIAWLIGRFRRRGPQARPEQEQ